MAKLIGESGARTEAGARDSEPGRSTNSASHDSNQPSWERLAPETWLHRRVDTEAGEQRGELCCVDQHVVVDLIVATPEFAVDSDKSRHRTPEGATVRN